MRRTSLALLLALLGAEVSQAQEQTFLLPNIIDEVRVGVHAHEAHYSLWPVYVDEWDLSQIRDISFDVLFRSPEVDVFRWIGSPRPELGTTINLAGVESTFHAALTWQVPVFDTPVFLEGTFGAALHNGYMYDAPDGRRNLGCRINFYERFGVGVNVTETATALLTYEHTSNADLCDSNSGYSNFGLRIGMKF
jgi:Lipid A 3-O-deacylase (PagL).